MSAIFYHHCLLSRTLIYIILCFLSSAATSVSESHFLSPSGEFADTSSVVAFRPIPLVSLVHLNSQAGNHGYHGSNSSIDRSPATSLSDATQADDAMMYIQVEELPETTPSDMAELGQPQFSEIEAAISNDAAVPPLDDSSAVETAQSTRVGQHPPTTLQDFGNRQSKRGAKGSESGDAWLLRDQERSLIENPNRLARKRKILQRPASQEHPIKKGRHPLLWKYQFATLIFALFGMYGIQLLIDFKAQKTWNLNSKPSTCLMMGANVKGLDLALPSTCARFFTCAFLHAHIFHLVFNALSIYAAWLYFSVGPGRGDAHVWVYHWTFPVFMVTAFLGSLYSYFSTLEASLFSIGGSGGCLGLCSAFLIFALRFEGIPRYRRLQLTLTVVSIVTSCIPWEAFCKLTTISSVRFVA